MLLRQLQTKKRDSKLSGEQFQKGAKLELHKACASELCRVGKRGFEHATIDDCISSSDQWTVSKESNYTKPVNMYFWIQCASYVYV